jgi:hypothetical protein
MDLALLSSLYDPYSMDLRLTVVKRLDSDTRKSRGTPLPTTPVIVKQAGGMSRKCGVHTHVNY